MSEKCFCHSCGQSIMKHKHSLSRSLTLILSKAAAFKGETFHLQKDLNLTKNEYANFQKLQYWHLVGKVKDQSGYWEITSFGRHFLDGTFKPVKSVWTFNNKVISTEGVVSIFELKLEPMSFKHREEYIDDALPVFDFSNPQIRFV